MIHYHGTPIGGSRQDAARFLVGRHALVSFYRPDDLPAAMDFCQSFCLDNGAFSHWKAGKGEIDFSAYYDWVQTMARHPNLDWALIPDKIDGEQSDNEALIDRWLSTTTKVEGVPVYHLHESLEWLEQLVNNFRTIAIGSSGQWATPGTYSWWQRIAHIMPVICDGEGRPKCRIHGLRMLDPEIFSRLPFSSADSTNAAVNGGSISRFGIYPPATASQRSAVIADRIESHNSASHWSGSQQQMMAI